MTPTRFRRLAVLAVLAVALLSLPSCATAHLLRWNVDEPSVFSQNGDPGERAVIHPGGTIAAFPVFLVWDVATFPFQLIWGIYPYGGSLSPQSLSQ